jgi:chorismate synthase
MLRFLTAGESHGRALVVIIEGLPAGLAITAEDLQTELARRRLGFGRGPRMKFEQDEVTLVGGIRHGRTLGSPVAIEIGNSEWHRPGNKWNDEMSPAPGTSSAPLTKPRPGHADLTGMQKYDLTDARNVLERASARETAARVAAGAVAKALLRELGVEVLSHVLQIGSVRTKSVARPAPSDLERVDASEVRCFDAATEAAMIDEIRASAKEGDSLGGIVEVLGFGVPVGLGSHVHWDRKIDARLAQALMSIQAVKGVEIGEGFDVAGRRGSAAHDPISWDATSRQYRRETTLAGGIEGGMTTGELLVARAAMKPLATLNRPTLGTVDMATKAETVSFKERTDVTAVPAMGVVAETMTALVLADEVLRKFGGDSVRELVRNVEGYAAQVLDHTDRTEVAPAGEGGALNWNETEAFEVAAGEAAPAEPPVEPLPAEPFDEPGAPGADG